METTTLLPCSIPSGLTDSGCRTKIVAYFGMIPSSHTWKPNADIDNDRKIEMKDIAIVASEFGSHGPSIPNPGSPASPNWNPNADVAGLQYNATTQILGGKVDLCDIVEIAANFGRHYS